MNQAQLMVRMIVVMKMMMPLSKMNLIKKKYRLNRSTITRILLKMTFRYLDLTPIITPVKLEVIKVSRTWTVLVISPSLLLKLRLLWAVRSISTILRKKYPKAGKRDRTCTGKNL